MLIAAGSKGVVAVPIYPHGHLIAGVWVAVANGDSLGGSGCNLCALSCVVGYAALPATGVADRAYNHVADVLVFAAGGGAAISGGHVGHVGGLAVVGRVLIAADNSTCVDHVGLAYYA